jgi:predicted glycoside hydrolase/deacetylase ChbG (UPF0249 family)
MEMMHSSREKLVVSADDFGKSPAANENILFLAKRGKIDRVSVLASRAFPDTDIAALLDSKVKIDLHLDINRFSFSQKSEKNKSPFARAAVFLWHYLLRGFSASKVTAEWEVQMERFEKLFGKKPDGLNSHQYIHFFPPYFKIILNLGAKYNIPYIRFGKTGITKDINSISGILRCLHKMNVSLFKKFSFDSSDFLASYDWIGNFPGFLEKLPPGKTELIFHPERKKEFEAFKN